MPHRYGVVELPSPEGLPLPIENSKARRLYWTQDRTTSGTMAPVDSQAVLLIWQPRVNLSTLGSSWTEIGLKDIKGLIGTKPCSWIYGLQLDRTKCRSVYSHHA